MDEIEFYANINLENIGNINKEKENLFDDYFTGTEKLWKNDNPKNINDILCETKICGRQFLKQGQISYLEIFEDKRTNLLGMSNKISLLYIPHECKNNEYNENKCIGFRYYDKNKEEKCHYFTLIKRYDNSRFFILEKENNIIDSEGESFYNEKLDCFSIIKEIVFEKLCKENNIIDIINGELIQEILGFAYALVSKGKFKSFIALEPLILDSLNYETKIEKIPKNLEENVGYIEPLLYNNHVSVVLIKKSEYNPRKRVNIFLDMSKYHSNENLLDNTIFPTEIYINNYSYPKYPIQKNNTCSTWYYGIIECLYSNEKYKDISDVTLNINRNSPNFFIDVINTLSSKLYNKNNIIEVIKTKFDPLNEKRISELINGKSFSFTKEAFQNNFFSISNLFKHIESDCSGLGLLFEYQILMDKIKDYIRLAKLNKEYFKNYSDIILYKNVQEPQYEELILSLEKHLIKVNLQFNKEFFNVIYNKYLEYSLFNDMDTSQKKEADYFLKKNKSQITLKIDSLQSEFDAIKGKKRNIAIKDEFSIIKNINPNNDLAFLILNS